MSYLLQCVWPIEDETYTRSQLIAEAMGDLERLAEQCHAVITGPPLWMITDAELTPGWHAYAPGSLLVALMPAERYGTVREHRVEDAGEAGLDHAAVYRAVWQRDPSGLRRHVDKRAAVDQLAARGLPDSEIAEHVGSSTKAVGHLRARNGITKPGRAEAA